MIKLLMCNGITCESFFFATRNRKKNFFRFRCSKIWNLQKKYLSLQCERSNQVEPRCAERWHGCRNAEMMSNSTLPLGFSSLRILSWSRVASFYIFRYFGSVNSAGSFILVAVIKFT